MNATTLILCAMFLGIFLIILFRPKKCGVCIPEDFIPLNDELNPTARAQARLALTYLENVKVFGEDPSEVGDEIDPESIVMMQGGYPGRPKHVKLPSSDIDDGLYPPTMPIEGTYGMKESFSASLPSTEIAPNKTMQWWYYNYPYALTTDTNGLGASLNGGGISSNWWIGSRYRYGMFPQARWRKWNGKYMYIANDGALGADKNAPLS